MLRTKIVHTHIDARLHQYLRVAASLKDCSIRDIIEEAILDYMTRHPEKKLIEDFKKKHNVQ